MSDLFGNHIIGFLMMRFKCFMEAVVFKYQKFITYQSIFNHAHTPTPSLGRGISQFDFGAVPAAHKHPKFNHHDNMSV